jgi:hypothetical protein
MEARVINTQTLSVLAERGARKHLNRQLDLRSVGAVDPDGLHVLAVILPYHNGIAAKQGPHHRCEILIKRPDTTEPSTAVIDVLVEDFNRLTTASEYLAAAQ